MKPSTRSQLYRKGADYGTITPGVTKEDLIKKVADNRAAIRQHLVSFLTPEQLTKWDAEATKRKSFQARSSQPNQNRVTNKLKSSQPQE